MKQISLRAAKHICAVPACKCTETFKVSGSPNLLGGFYICQDCIAEIAKLAKPRKAQKEK
ncbi:MAG: hypothetical protein IIX18_00500 [Clostridia bacterium]|nr:hypothetical protein [Clostridia bacterium]MBQ6613780.1 hypothetical protein [Clostridia bacterium]